MLAKFGVHSVLPTSQSLPANNSRFEVLWGTDLLHLNLDLLDGQNRFNGHTMEATAISSVQKGGVVLLDEYPHDFSMELWILAKSADEG